MFCACKNPQSHLSGYLEPNDNGNKTQLGGRTDVTTRTGVTGTKQPLIQFII